MSRRWREQVLVQIHVRNTDKCGMSALSDLIPERAVRAGLSGITALRGILGLDINGQILSDHWWSMVEHRPLMFETIGPADKIAPFIASLDEILLEGLITAQPILVRTLDEDESAVEAGSDADEKLSAGGKIMLDQPTEVKLLRIFIDESDRHGGKPLYQQIVHRAQEAGVLLASVYRSAIGIGETGVVHTDKVLEASTHLPLVIEIIDTEDKLAPIVQFLDETFNGLVTIETVSMQHVRSGRHAK